MAEKTERPKAGQPHIEIIPDRKERCKKNEMSMETNGNLEEKERKKETECRSEKKRSGDTQRDVHGRNTEEESRD